MKHLSLYIIVTAVLSACVGEKALAQRLIELTPKSVPHYSCVHYDCDTLEFPGGRQAFNRFYNKLNTVVYEERDSSVSILHIGGSHVQAGFFSNRMRSNISRMSATTQGNRGCLFPFRALRTNAPAGYEISSTGKWNGARCVEKYPARILGLTGASVQTADTLASLTIDLSACDSSRWSFNRLRVLGTASSEQVTPLIEWGNDTLRPATVVAGDSYLFHLPTDTNTCRIVFEGMEEGAFELRGLIPEQTGKGGITYHEAGVNGAAVPSWLKCELFAQELKYIAPDMVIFGIGINDANVPASQFNPETFKNNYRELMERIRSVSPDCVFLFVTNNDCFLRVKRYKRTYNPNTLKVEKAFRELAAECGGAVWNQFRVMGGYRSSASWQYAGLMRADRIHFTREGYELLGDLMYNALLTDYLQFNGIK
ncbi:MAG: GDSL-type esterase/lipase family protein [Clostridium sp.]|nr:GDSL-type esterase/lipase family protein [Clostridium sp.]